MNQLKETEQIRPVSLERYDFQIFLCPDDCAAVLLPAEPGRNVR